MDTNLLKSKLLSRIIIDDKTKCWNWQGANVRGYGVLATGTKSKGTWKQYYSHRLSYQLFRGEIPELMQIDHLCRHPQCINPNHLEVVTTKENIQRGETGLKNKVKTHCPSGHEYNEKNTYITKNGSRTCRVCIREKKNAERTANPEKYRLYMQEYRKKHK